MSNGSYGHSRHSGRGARTASKLRGLVPINLQRLEQLLRREPQPEEDRMPPVDPWPSARKLQYGEKFNPEDPNSAPRAWWQLRPDARAFLGGALTELLAEFPDRRRPQDYGWLAARAWERCRTDRAIERELGRVDLDAPNPLEILREAIVKLLAMSDVEASLRRRRGEIDQQLAVLAKRRAPAPPDDKGA
jgi:hypothetical protein